MPVQTIGRENIPLSQIVTFKRQEYPSQDEFDQTKNKIIGEWEGVSLFSLFPFPLSPCSLFLVPFLFPDTELTKNIPQQIICGDFTCDLTQVVQGSTDVQRQ